MNRITGTLLFILVVCGGVFTNAFTATSPLTQLSLRSTASSNNEQSSMNHQNKFVCSTRTTTTHLAAGPLEVIDPSYNLALGSLALGAAFGVPKSKLSAFIGGIPLLLFGLFLAFQTTTLRFTFDDDNFSLVKSSGESLGENVVVGGENVWAYDKFVNYDMFPSRSFPILVYFKETQTPEEMWNVGPGEQANSEEAIAKGAVPGQVHFFPAIANTEDLWSSFEKHGCAKIE